MTTPEFSSAHNQHRLQVALIGSRGIPASYGGAETFVEEIAHRLIEKRLKVVVTCESNRFIEDSYQEITRLHVPAIQGKTLTIPTVNDILATIYLLYKHPRVQLIYYVTPDAALAALIPRILGKRVVINTDGIEWKRPILRRPYFSPCWKCVSYLTSWYLKFSEWLAVKLAHTVVADSIAIKDYLKSTYGTNKATYISYGARKLLSGTASIEEKKVLADFGLATQSYYLTVGRIVAENNIHLEISGFRRTHSSRRLVIVGNFNPKDSYNRYLTRLKDEDHRIAFLDPIYDRQVLGTLRKHCFAYIHAYELGGTNPSLLEQMVFGRPILTLDVPFHREVLRDGGIYFKNEDDLAQCITMLEDDKYDLARLAASQSRRLAEEYNWETITEKYVALFHNLLQPLK
jgi:glycosyltransferase involved in cell wall biosynthesis